MASDWHGYPVAEGAHPERPWWRWYEADGLWRRADGASVHEAPFADGYGGQPPGRGLAAHDAANSLPAPPPQCGQVWRWDSGFAATVQAVDPTGLSAPGVAAPGIVWPASVPIAGARFASVYVVCWTPMGQWPPEGAALVAGPGSPWMEVDNGE